MVLVILLYWIPLGLFGSFLPHFRLLGNDKRGARSGSDDGSECTLVRNPRDDTRSRPNIALM